MGAIAMGKTRDMGHYFNAGLAKMSGVAMLLVGTRRSVRHHLQLRIEGRDHFLH